LDTTHRLINPPLKGRVAEVFDDKSPSEWPFPIDNGVPLTVPGVGNNKAIPSVDPVMPPSDGSFEPEPMNL
jgi:hypothetical protein